MANEHKTMEEHGERLGTFGRGDGTELRLNLEERNGCEFVVLRVWVRNHGEWFPTRQSCTIHLREMEDVASILERVAFGADAPPRKGPASRPGAAKPKRQRQVYVPPKGHGWGTPEARQAALAAASDRPPWEGESLF